MMWLMSLIGTLTVLEKFFIIRSFPSEMTVFRRTISLIKNAEPMIHASKNMSFSFSSGCGWKQPSHIAKVPKPNPVIHKTGRSILK